ncbi:hypothetical protein H5410_040619 [Solanum commersonii]|uniref:Uncharacterized protein n=1 Tax=Solanum commersonii TaxID=4109 RepID=A0A9J5XPG1_SOLCO|nr:hypothetical protein H5410_040619 [Solanum commersonii]
MGLEIAFCSSVLSPEGKGQVGDEMEQSAHRQSIPLKQEGDEIDQKADRREGRKTKTTKLIVGGIGSTWVQLKRVSPSPSTTHSARESEWAKAEAVLNAAAQCLRETELIRGKLLKREFTPTIV